MTVKYQPNFWNLARKQVSYLAHANNKSHDHIDVLNPDVKTLRDSYQDFLFKIKQFDAGNGYQNFNEFISDEAIDYADDGNGVTYVVWNILKDKNGHEIDRDIVSFYTLAVTSIPYIDRIRLDEEEAKATGEIYDKQNCAVSAIEIKMFAVNQKYQNIFFEYGDEDLPVSVWVLRSIIDYIENLSKTIVGVKAAFLHAVPDAVDFYLRNGFEFMLPNMEPFHSIDSEFTPMFLALYELHINFDE